MNTHKPGTKEYFAREHEILNEDAAFEALMRTQFAEPTPEAAEPAPPTEPVELKSMRYGATVYRSVESPAGEHYFEMQCGKSEPRKMDNFDIRELSNAYAPVGDWLAENQPRKRDLRESERMKKDSEN